MNKRSSVLKLVVILSLCIGLIPVSVNDHKASAFSNQVIQHGAVGDDVIELQSRLQYLGFYNRKIDGVFGWSTYWALRNFQFEFGLPIDGLAGPKTKAKLVKASNYDERYVKEQIRKGNKFTHYGGVDLNKQTKPKTGGGKAQPQQKQQKPQNQAQQQNQAKQPNQAKQQNQAKQPNQAQQQNQAKQQNRAKPPAAKPPAAKPPATKNTPKKPTAVNTPNGFSQNDIQLMANAVYGEARGEPYEGQVAVAAVILNRLESATFPNTVSGVIFEPLAFTAVADGQIWLTPNEKAKKAVLDAINGWDPSENATYYFNPDTATSSWIWGRPQIKRIGKHIFCR